MSEVGYKKPPIEHRFKKGNKLGGKTKGSFSLINLLRHKIQECPEGQDKATYADLIIKRMLKESIEKGDISHIRIIWEYLESKPIQGIDVKSGGKTIFMPFEMINKYDLNSKPESNSEGQTSVQSS